MGVCVCERLQCRVCVIKKLEDDRKLSWECKRPTGLSDLRSLHGEACVRVQLIEWLSGSLALSQVDVTPVLGHSG